MLKTRHAYSTLFWVGFLTFAVVPLLALAINVGRWFYARAEMYKAADAAALAAVQEVDVPIYIETGQIIIRDTAFGKAQEYATLNANYLISRKIYPSVTAIEVDNARKTVRVKVMAAAEELVPLIGTVYLYGEGEAQVRGRFQP